MKIFINSYTYTYERHLRMFDFFNNKKDLVFILPRLWKAKGGKIKVVPPEKPEYTLITTWAPFYHSHYPVIRGMLKGWMPWCGRILRRLAKPGDVLLSSAEPNLLTTYLYGRLARRLGLKHVFLTWQNIDYTRRLKGLKLKITEWLLRENIRLSAGALCGTRQAYDILKPYLNDEIKTAVIPQSGVDTEIFKPGVVSDFRQRHNLHGKIIYLFGAVFDERKGVFTTIQAFQRTLTQVPEGHLVMIGIGKLWSSAQELVKKLNLIHKITFIEWLPNNELPGIFASVDILVHPSEPYRDWEEQYGWTLLQAQASGLPVIATTIGAINEAVIDKKTGILVEPKNIDALADAMIYLARNPEVRKQMAAAGIAHINENFSHVKIAHRLETFLYNL
mgnify:CR=1 FL=1